MSKMRKVKHVQGYGKFTGSNTLEVEGKDGKTTISASTTRSLLQALSLLELPFIPHDDRACNRFNWRLGNERHSRKNAGSWVVVSSVLKWVRFIVHWVHRLMWLNSLISLSLQLTKTYHQDLSEVR